MRPDRLDETLDQRRALGFHSGRRGGGLEGSGHLLVDTPGRGFEKRCAGTAGLTQGRLRRRTTNVRALVFVVLLMCVVLSPLAPRTASADVGQRFPRITRLSEEVVRGGMPLGYVPLRQLWAEWDQG